MGTASDVPASSVLGFRRVLEIYFLVSVIWSDALQNFVSPK